jgi:hypothetical protein
MLPLVTRLVEEFRGWRAPPKRRNKAFDSAVEYTLGVLTTNLLEQATQRSSSFVYAIGRPGWYTENKFWLGPITHSTVQLVVEFLRDSGYVEFVEGRASSSVSFRRPNAKRAKPKLVQLFRERRLSIVDAASVANFYPVRLKAPKDSKGRKAHLPFVETPQTRQMAEHITAINNKLLSHWADIRITDDQMTQLGRELEAIDDDDENADQLSVNLTKRTIYRVFNNGSFDEGGRFYGGWWQSVPKVWRPYITINGKQTVEVDYSAMHPTILYHWEGLEIPDEPYLIGFGSKEVVKATFNALINARGGNLKPVKGFDEQHEGMSWKEFLAAVRAHFHQFEKYFGSGVGLKLQKLDSDIAELVMLDFVEKEVPLLPVHDSFLCHHSLEGELRGAMETRFMEVVGGPISMKSKELDLDQQRSIQDTSSSSHEDLLASGLSEVEALISLDHAYAAYYKRLDDWFSRRSDLNRSK